jgi:hypothetical protein
MRQQTSPWEEGLKTGKKHELKCWRRDELGFCKCAIFQVAQNAQSSWKEPGPNRMSNRFENKAINISKVYISQMLFDLGVDKDKLDSQDETKRVISLIEKKFDIGESNKDFFLECFFLNLLILVLISEHFDKSIVFLKNRLCWQYKDVASLKLNYRLVSVVTKYIGVHLRFCDLVPTKSGVRKSEHKFKTFRNRPSQNCRMPQRNSLSPGSGKTTGSTITLRKSLKPI